jgi:hypothetical protein
MPPIVPLTARPANGRSISECSLLIEQHIKEIGIRKVLGLSVSGLTLLISRKFSKSNNLEKQGIKNPRFPTASNSYFLLTLDPTTLNNYRSKSWVKTKMIKGACR